MLWHLDSNPVQSCGTLWNTRFEFNPSFTIPDYSCKNKGSHRNGSVKIAHLCLCLNRQYESEVSGSQSSHLESLTPLLHLKWVQHFETRWSRNKSGWKMQSVYCMKSPLERHGWCSKVFHRECLEVAYQPICGKLNSSPESLIWNASQINTSPVHWRKMIQPVQSSITRDRTGLLFSLCDAFCWCGALLNAIVCISASIVKQRPSYGVRLRRSWRA